MTQNVAKFFFYLMVLSYLVQSCSPKKMEISGYHNHIWVLNDTLSPNIDESYPFIFAMDNDTIRFIHSSSMAIHDYTPQNIEFSLIDSTIHFEVDGQIFIAQKKGTNGLILINQFEEKEYVYSGIKKSSPINNGEISNGAYTLDGDSLYFSKNDAAMSRKTVVYMANSRSFSFPVYLFMFDSTTFIYASVPSEFRGQVIVPNISAISKNKISSELVLNLGNTTHKLSPIGEKEFCLPQLSGMWINTSSFGSIDTIAFLSNSTFTYGSDILPFYFSVDKNILWLDGIANQLVECNPTAETIKYQKIPSLSYMLHNPTASHKNKDAYFTLQKINDPQ